ncbi:hypothetical protein P7K49_027942, partial [Saguinus oedipus]
MEPPPVQASGAKFQHGASFSPAPTSSPLPQQVLIPLTVPSNVAAFGTILLSPLCLRISSGRHASHPRVPPYMGALFAFLSSWEGLKELLGTQADLAPHEHLLKLMDLMLRICQAVIQARGDLDEDKASI